MSLSYFGLLANSVMETLAKIISSGICGMTIDVLCVCFIHFVFYLLFLFDFFAVYCLVCYLERFYVAVL